MSSNENQLEDTPFIEYQKRVITDESEMRNSTEDLSTKNKQIIPQTDEQQEFQYNGETAQFQNALETLEQQNSRNNKEQFLQQSQNGITEGIGEQPSVQQHSNRQQQKSDKGRQDASKQSFQQKKDILNDSLLLQQSKKIKTHLLQNHLEKPQIIQQYPVNQVGMFPNNQVSQLNYFYYDNPPLLDTDVKLYQTKIDSKQMQQHLQALQNRVLLLEKEDRKAKLEFKNMQKQTQKVTQAKMFYEERKQLNDYVRLQREDNQSQKLMENKFFKSFTRANLQSRMNESNQQQKQKANTVRQQLQKLKQQQNINNDQVIQNNIQQYNQIKEYERQAEMRKIAHSDDRKAHGTSQYDRRIQVEETLNSLKLQEYAELEEKEKQLLSRLSKTQSLFNSAVKDMQKVINIPIKPNSNSQIDVQKIRRDILNLNYISPSQSKIATKISDNFIAKVQQSKLTYSTIQFPLPEDLNSSKNQNGQVHKISFSGAQSALNTVNTPQNTMPTQIQTFRSEYHENGKSSRHMSIDGEDEEYNKLRSTKSYSSQRKYRVVRQQNSNSKQGSSLIDSIDPYASTMGSSQFKSYNHPKQEFSQSSRSFYPSNYQKPLQVKSQNNMQMRAMIGNINIGQPFTPQLVNKKRVMAQTIY